MNTNYAQGNLNMASQKSTVSVPLARTVTPPVPTEPDEFSFEVGDYAVGKHRATSKVPDTVADLLEDLRTVYHRDVKDAKGVVIPAGTVKFKTVSFRNEGQADAFAKHVRSYSKTVMYPEWSARLSRLSETMWRVGVGPVKPKPRRPREPVLETPDAD